MNSYYISSYDILPIESVGTRVKDAINIAIEASKESSAPYRHGSVCFKKQSIYKVGINDYTGTILWARTPIDRVSPQIFLNSETDKYFSVHAEIACINNLPRKKVNGSSIAVVRINKIGDLVLSQPCSKCVFTMNRVGIAKCYFSIDDNYLGLLKFKNT